MPCSSKGISVEMTVHSLLLKASPLFLCLSGKLDLSRGHLWYQLGVVTQCVCPVFNIWR